MNNMGKISYLVMDVDGTLTDGKIYMSGSGEVFKAFNIKDGYGIHDLAMAKGITPIIITGRKSDIVLQRSEELGISEVHQGIKNKVERLLSLVEDISEVAYIGDDDNDLECMKLIKEKGGLIGCPKNASVRVMELSDYVSSHDGGDGAVRDYIEWILFRKDYER